MQHQRLTEGMSYGTSRLAARWAGKNLKTLKIFPSFFFTLLDSLRQQRSPDCSIMPDVMTLEKSKKDRGDRHGRPASRSISAEEHLR
jgi:hypothetical protein